MKGRPRVMLTARIEMEKLQRNQRLVMIHADDGIEFSLNRPVKKGIRRPGAGNGQALFPGLSAPRRTIICLFVSEKPAFPGVRVQGGHAQAGGGDPEEFLSPWLVISITFEIASSRKGFRHGLKGDMGGNQEPPAGALRPASSRISWSEKFRPGIPCAPETESPRDGWPPCSRDPSRFREPFRLRASRPAFST